MFIEAQLRVENASIFVFSLSEPGNRENNILDFSSMGPTLKKYLRFLFSHKFTFFTIP
jgi:hypothetical protein